MYNNYFEKIYFSMWKKSSKFISGATKENLSLGMITVCLMNLFYSETKI